MVRLQDLHLYQPQLQSYKESSVSFDNWIEATRKKQETLQATKIDNVQALTDLINHQKVSFLLFIVFEALLHISSGVGDLMRLSFCAAKALNSDIISKRETLDGVLKANIACRNSIKVRMLAFCAPSKSFIKTMNFVFQDYETDLAAYTSGLETLLNIPIKRTMLKSPTVDLNQEVAD